MKREMNFRQKVQYFWDYHKWKVIIPGAVLAMAASFFSSYREATRDKGLQIALVNAELSDPSEVVFGEEYREARGLDDAMPVLVETGLIHPRVMDESRAADTVAAAGVQKYRLLLLEGAVDVTAASDWVIEEYAAADAYCELSALLSEELYERAGEAGLLFFCAGSGGEEVCVGIRIARESALGRYYPEGGVIAVSERSERKECAVDFIEWIMEG